MIISVKNTEQNKEYITKLLGKNKPNYIGVWEFGGGEFFYVDIEKMIWYYLFFKPIDNYQLIDDMNLLSKMIRKSKIEKMLK